MRLEFDLKLALAVFLVVGSVAAISIYYALSPVQPVDQDRAVYACIFLCKAARNQGESLARGPCISSGLDAWEMTDWVCDIAHSPRQAIDDQPVNQCPEYGVTARHFVELDPECGLIRAV